MYIQDEDPNAGDENPHCAGMMKSWGIAESLTEAVVDPKYQETRMIQPARIWLVNSVLEGTEALTKSLT